MVQLKLLYRENVGSILSLCILFSVEYLIPAVQNVRTIVATTVHSTESVGREYMWYGGAVMTQSAIPEM